jgi:hypothetical protein
VLEGSRWHPRALDVPDHRNPGMTAAVAGGLLVFAVLDGSFAGFRSSAARTGLIIHRRSDYQAARRGAGLVCLVLAAVIAAACADAVAHPGNLGDYTRAGHAMLTICGPCALVVLVALASHATLTWRFKYLASGAHPRTPHTAPPGYRSTRRCIRDRSEQQHSGRHRGKPVRRRGTRRRATRQPDLVREDNPGPPSWYADQPRTRWVVTEARSAPRRAVSERRRAIPDLLNHR